MRYISTRGEAVPRGFDSVLLAGLAEDGGLFVPESWPVFSLAEWRALRGLPYAELAARVMAPFVCGESIEFAHLQRFCRDAYRSFAHPAVVPLVQLDHSLFVLELFHGPTLAFKDLALQVAGRLFDHVLNVRGSRVTIVGATSGDTGSAAISACRDRARVDIVILHPAGRTSEVQRRQMTTVLSANVLNVAIEGNFDDCQDLVKAMFSDAPFRESMRLTAINSINWARIAGQIPYFVAAALALGAPDREVAVAVPTGNFGNVLAAWVAKQMGLPISQFVVASNANDILHRFLASNDMSVAQVVETASPSMDIQVSSNFERLLFEFLGNDASATAEIMKRFRASGRMAVPDSVWTAIRREFKGFSLDDPSTLTEIAGIYAACGYQADPHTAIGIAAARATAPVGMPVIAAATAHPAKFPETMYKALGVHPGLPSTFSDLYNLPERLNSAPVDLAAVKQLVRQFANRNDR